MHTYIHLYIYIYIYTLHQTTDWAFRSPSVIQEMDILIILITILIITIITVNSSDKQHNKDNSDIDDDESKCCMRIRMDGCNILGACEHLKLQRQVLVDKLYIYIYISYIYI